MHVAYIHQYFSTTKGTTGTRSYEMSQRLIAAGHKVSMICGVTDIAAPELRTGQHLSKIELDGIDVHCIAEPYSNKMGFARRLLAFGRFARQATRVIANLDADLVFATSTPLTVGIPGMKGAKKLGVPFVFEVRDRWPEIPIAIGVLKNPLLIWYAQRMERRIYRAARHIIALSPGMRDGIASTGYPINQITMIPNGCDIELFQPSEARVDDPQFGDPNDFHLVFTGAHGLANGLDAVLDAAAVLKKRGVSGIRFVFIGHGKLKQHLVQRSQDEGTADIISWIDPIAKVELARLLPRMDVGMMVLKNLPAFYYGTSPNKFFDYIASGLPVLNNYPGWVADMLGKNDCGLAVPPDNAEAFADAVVTLRDDPDRRRRMGMAGRALAEREFGRDKLGSAFVKVLEQAHSGL